MGNSILLCISKCFFMSQYNQPSDSLQDIRNIRKIMERSSRFISLSGLSGIAAGICAMAGCWFANDRISSYYAQYNDAGHFEGPAFQRLKFDLLILAAVVLSVALVSSFYFTWRRAKQNQLPVWDLTSRKLAWNIIVPLAGGGLFILAMLQYNEWRFVAPASLIFYGLALVSGSKYTLSDIRFLGYLEIVLGLVSTQFTGYGLYFWAAGFGVLHVVYGVIMWMKYEWKNAER
jgi:hypothetical protein